MSACITVVGELFVWGLKNDRKIDRPILLRESVRYSNIKVGAQFSVVLDLAGQLMVMGDLNGSGQVEEMPVYLEGFRDRTIPLDGKRFSAGSCYAFCVGEGREIPVPDIIPSPAKSLIATERVLDVPAIFEQEHSAQKILFPDTDR